jgi:hypothetical protein
LLVGRANPAGHTACRCACSAQATIKQPRQFPMCWTAALTRLAHAHTWSQLSCTARGIAAVIPRPPIPTQYDMNMQAACCCGTARAGLGGLQGCGALRMLDTWRCGRRGRHSTQVGAGRSDSPRSCQSCIPSARHLDQPTAQLVNPAGVKGSSQMAADLVMCMDDVALAAQLA